VSADKYSLRRRTPNSLKNNGVLLAQEHPVAIN
jgi:hypothetical protein